MDKKHVLGQVIVAVVLCLLAFASKNNIFCDALYWIFFCETKVPPRSFGWPKMPPALYQMAAADDEIRPREPVESSHGR